MCECVAITEQLVTNSYSFDHFVVVLSVVHAEADRKLQHCFYRISLPLCTIIFQLSLIRWKNFFILYTQILLEKFYILFNRLIYESSIVVNVNDFQVNYFSLTIMYIY